MRTSLLILILIILSPILYSQDNSLPELETSFAAIMVKDFDTSVNWYSNILGYEILTKRNVKEMGLKQANLSNGISHLEIIELNSALNSEYLLKDYPSKTKINGLFKIGFQVNRFDDWINHLQKWKVNFIGDTVLDPVSNKKMIIFTDPDGNRIQLFAK